ncbi:MAG: hypothetical protein KC422_02195 [Trueperaceae bacterium]|nr:hypothetical protein [Trueperaceae bacterium]
MALVIVAIAASMFLYFADALRITRLSRQETQATTFAKNYLTSLQSYWQTPENYTFGLGYAKELAEAVPEPYRLDVTITNEANETLAQFPEGVAVAKDESRLRKITLMFTDDKGKLLVIQSDISYPPPRP